jgi:hypothetical protein
MLKAVTHPAYEYKHGYGYEYEYGVRKHGSERGEGREGEH